MKNKNEPTKKKNSPNKLTTTKNFLKKNNKPTTNTEKIKENYSNS
jgi:hypothetical protein